MKTLENKQTDTPVDGTDKKAKWSDFALFVLSDQGRGLKLDELGKRLKVIERMEKAEDVIEFEDEDVEVLKRAIQKKDGTWPMNKDLYEFLESVMSL